MQCIINYDKTNHFPIENIPFGCFFNKDHGKIHCCTRIGDEIIDLAILWPFFQGPLFKQYAQKNKNVFKNDTLNDFADLGVEYRIEARDTI